jgi:hypothetical protein
VIELQLEKPGVKLAYLLSVLGYTGRELLGVGGDDARCESKAACEWTVKVQDVIPRAVASRS